MHKPIEIKKGLILPHMISVARHNSIETSVAFPRTLGPLLVVVYIHKEREQESERIPTVHQSVNTKIVQLYILSVHLRT